MATAKVILYTHKTLKDGSHPVNLQVVVNRRVIRKSLKMSCRLEDWDEENRTFKRSHPNYKHDSKVLSKFKARLTDTMDWFDFSGIEFTHERFRQRMKLGGKPKQLLELFDDIVSNLKSENRHSYARVFKETRNALGRYIGRRSVVLQDVNVAFLRGLETFLRQLGNADSSIHNRMRTLRTAYNTAISPGYISEDLYIHSLVQLQEPVRDIKICFLINSVNCNYRRYDLAESRSIRIRSEKVF